MALLYLEVLLHNVAVGRRSMLSWLEMNMLLCGLLDTSITDGMVSVGSITDAGMLSCINTFLTNGLPGLAVMKASFNSSWGHLGVEVILARLVVAPSAVLGE